MSNPCPEILQSAQLQVALGKGKRRKAFWYKALFKLAHQINFQFPAAGSKRERERTQMRAIESLLALLTTHQPRCEHHKTTKLPTRSYWHRTRLFIQEYRFNYEQFGSLHIEHRHRVNTLALEGLTEGAGNVLHRLGACSQPRR